MDKLLICVPKERLAGERRVAATPASVLRLAKLGFAVAVETGAGTDANYRDEDYVAAGARIEPDVRALWGSANLLLKVQPPEPAEIDMLREHAVLLGFIWPARNGALLERLAARKATALGIDCVPRISRAQKLDALSSMANIAGYRAVIEAAQYFGSFFTGQITAAGKVPPAKMMVIGAGVAGLAAIGTAKGLGAIVRAFDTRPEVKEQVQSMGAEFLELDFKEEGTGEGGYAKVMSEAFIKAEMALFAAQAKDVDIIVTTALIPGKRAPILITEEMVRSMREGSVVVDLAAENGGNCELTVPGEVVRKHGVTIIGYTDLPSRLPTQASALYANNLVNLLTDMTKGGAFSIDQTDEVVRGALVMHEGVVTWPPPKVAAVAAAPRAPAATVSAATGAAPASNKPSSPAPSSRPSSASKSKSSHGHGNGASKGVSVLTLAGLGVGLLVIGRVAPPDFVQHLTVFVLACFIGWQVVWNVTPALHTPLMSVTNAISGIIVIGAMLQIGGNGGLSTILAAVAVLIATINVAGGFLVTQRMLAMFRK